MNTLINLADYDVIYMSYDEPDAEENWKSIKSWIPYAKRVQGVKGIAGAHMAAARLSTTDKTITIDGDNYLYRDLKSHKFVMSDERYTQDTLINWPSKNNINGLSYGNGGIKLWPTHVLANRTTNEMAPMNTSQRLDYCFGLSSQCTFHECFAETRINGAPLQAWRAGFREGIKLGLNRGVREQNLEKIWQGGLRRLTIWMTTGMDVANGIWAILGARVGCYLTHFTDWNINNINDYEYLSSYFNENYRNMNENDAYAECKRIESIICNKFKIFSPLDADQSKFFKSLNMNLESDPVYERPGFHWPKSN